MGAYHLTWFVVLLPLLGALSSFLAETHRRAAQVCVAFSALAFVLAGIVLGLRLTHPQQPPFNGSISFFAMSPPEGTVFATRFEPQLGIQVDALSASFGAAAAFVLVVVQAYALTWLRGEGGYRRFFWASSLFGFAVAAFIYSPNTFQSMTMWLAATAAAYLMTLHWAERPEAAAPGMRMFVLLRAADLALLLGVIYSFIKFGVYASLQAAPVGQNVYDPFSFGNLGQLAAAVHNGQVAGSGPKTLAVLASLFIFAAVVRAAQIPFQGWLSQLSGTPVPVLALGGGLGTVLGGYLLARSYGVLILVPHALTALALTGAVAALAAALMAMAQRDILRIAALAAVAESGLALTALGAGGYSQGAVVLFTGLFLTVLFALVSGNLTRVYRTRDVGHMGGAWKRMRPTSLALVVWATGIGGLSLNSYWALSAAFANAAPGPSRLGAVSRWFIVVLAAVAAVCIAAVAIRVVVRVCAGEVTRRRGFQHDRVREVERPLRRWTGVAAVAAVASVVGGLPGISPIHSGKLSVPGLTFTHFVFYGARRPNLPVDVMALLLALAALGIGAAAAVGIVRAAQRGKTPSRRLIPPLVASRLGEELLLERAVLHAGRPFVAAGAVLSAVDVRLVDEFVEASADAPGVVASLSRRAPLPRGPAYLAGGVVAVALLALLSVLAATGHLWVHTT